MNVITADVTEIRRRATLKRNILDFIEIARESFEGATEVYTRGSCFRFHLMLRHVYGGKPFHEFAEGHVVTKIDDTYYDINGVFEDNGKITTIEDSLPAGADPMEWRYKIKM